MNLQFVTVSEGIPSNMFIALICDEELGLR